MGKYFAQDTPLAGLERMMMTPPNFIPRGGGAMVLCRFHYGPDDVDCRNCLQYRRRSCSKPRCPYLTERLEAGTVTLEELAQELVRPWEHWGLKRRVVQLARRAGRFLFDGQLHIARMLKLTEGESNVSSRWTAAVYLLSSNATLWQRIRPAVKPGQIIFDAVKPGNASVKEYTLYRAAKGIYHGRLGSAADELAGEDIEKLNAVALMAGASGAGSICRLAENLDQFDFIPSAQTQESGGQLNECGYVAYHGAMPLEELMREEPAEQPEMRMI